MTPDRSQKLKLLYFPNLTDDLFIFFNNFLYVDAADWSGTDSELNLDEFC